MIDSNVSQYPGMIRKVNDKIMIKDFIRMRS